MERVSFPVFRSAAAVAALAVGAPVTAALVTSLLWPWLSPSVSPLFFPAIMLAAVRGGYAVGGAAAIVSMLLASYVSSSGPVIGFDDAVRMVTFLTTAFASASLVAARTAALEAANKTLQEEIAVRERLAERFVQVQEAERRDLARELHDQVGQTLTALKLSIESVSRDRGARTPAAAHALELVESLMQQIRELSLDLRPSVLDDLGLVPALLWHLDRYTAQTGITVTFSHAGLEERLPGDLETAAFRVVQEGLTNVARHAGVTQAALWARQDSGELCVIIEDAGRGFDAEVLPVGASSGITGMRERAMLLGGSFSVVSSPGSGTQITAVWPVRAAAAQEVM